MACFQSLPRAVKLLNLLILSKPLYRSLVLGVCGLCPVLELIAQKGLFPFLDACYYCHLSRALSSVSGSTLCGRPGSWPHSKLQFLLKSKHWKWLHEFIPAINVESATDGKETGSATANDGAKTTPSTAADVGRSRKFSNSLFYMEKLILETIEKKAKTGRRNPTKL